MKRCIESMTRNGSYRYGVDNVMKCGYDEARQHLCSLFSYFICIFHIVAVLVRFDFSFPALLEG